MCVKKNFFLVYIRWLLNRKKLIGQRGGNFYAHEYLVKHSEDPSRRFDSRVVAGFKDISCILTSDKTLPGGKELGLQGTGIVALKFKRTQGRHQKP